ncbi:hypothetical protein KSP40_PGU019128 [Platanthera guangdongensis]|uniref:Uncharacterized protein n=1 Tax=Platanthera guangdongensis TaxID=2320717 RepID=A0ABR2LKQ0_9ASPA
MVKVATFFGMVFGAFLFWESMDKVHVWMALRQDEKVLFSLACFESLPLVLVVLIHELIDLGKAAHTARRTALGGHNDPILLRSLDNMPEADLPSADTQDRGVPPDEGLEAQHHCNHLEIADLRHAARGGGDKSIEYPTPHLRKRPFPEKGSSVPPKVSAAHHANSIDSSPKKDQQAEVPETEFLSDVPTDQVTKQVPADNVIVEEKNIAQYDDEKSTSVHDGGSGIDIDSSSDQENLHDAQVDAEKVPEDSQPQEQVEGENETREDEGEDMFTDMAVQVEVNCFSTLQSLETLFSFEDAPEATVQPLPDRGWGTVFLVLCLRLAFNKTVCKIMEPLAKHPAPFLQPPPSRKLVPAAKIASLHSRELLSWFLDSHLLQLVTEFSLTCSISRLFKFISAVTVAVQQLDSHLEV